MNAAARTQTVIASLLMSREMLATSAESLKEQLHHARTSLHRASEELRRKNDELEQFTYAASHDLQEPLRKLICFSQLLAEDAGEDLNEQARQDLEHMADSVRRMQSLMDSLLTLSRVGRAAANWEGLSLRECVDDALDRLAQLVDESEGEILCESLPDVYGDATELTQVFENLISNALRFSDGERPCAHITAERRDDEWVLGVRDEGIGVDPQDTEKILAPLKRLHGRGAGMGLAICRKIVERHGGRVWVESTPGVGAHFKFTLPADDGVHPSAHAVSTSSGQAITRN